MKLHTLKRWAYGALYRIDQRFPVRMAAALRNRTLPFGRPILDAVELHVTDHCNLNCARCSHFSPFAQPWCLTPEEVERDLSVLRRKFRRIRHVNFVGGEPLLNTKLPEIIHAARAVCPHAVITVVTNGLALLGDEAARQSLADRFFVACRAENVRVKWSLYPPFKGRVAELVARFRSEGVPMRIEAADEFWARTVPDGSANAKRSFCFCRTMMYCPYLRSGRLYPCAQAYHLPDIIRAWGGLDACVCEGLDLSDSRLTGWDILKYLMSPCNACRYCSDSISRHGWAPCDRNPDTWMVAT